MRGLWRKKRMESEHQSIRLVVDNVISEDQCKELIHIHNVESVVGYREYFSVTMLQEIIRRGDFGYLIPVIKTRDIILQLVEESLGSYNDLKVEWTGISCWHANSSIPPHYDSNRPYLKQRHYSVVLYLNQIDVDFGGGLFHFSKTDRSPEQTIVPTPGRLVLFSSGPENMHFVDKITNGERFTFTVWFTLDIEFQEDPTIISFLNAHVQLHQTNNQSLEKPKIINTKEKKEDGKIEGDQIWDIMKFKKEKFNISNNNDYFMCSNKIIPLVDISLQEILDMCSFYLWKTDKLLSNCEDNLLINKFIQEWKEYKNNLNSTFWQNVALWKDTDLLYL